MRARRADTEKDAVINVAASATHMEKNIVEVPRLKTNAADLV